MSTAKPRSLLASLPMYLFAPAANQSLWQALADELRLLGAAHIPLGLTAPSDYHAHWLEPDLLLSQTCGFPLIDDLAGKVQLLGCFSYDVLGCTGVDCRSLVVVRQAQADLGLAGFRGKRVAYNSTDSQSGYNAFRALVAPLALDGSFFASALATGAHLHSLAAVREGRADITSVDCVSFAGFQRYCPEVVEGLAVMTMTEAYPGLPLITSTHTSAADVDKLRQALSRIFERADTSSARGQLFLTGFEAIPLARYDRIRQMRDAALALNYPHL